MGEGEKMPECLNCGHKYKTPGKQSRRFVMSCSQCNILLSDDKVEEIIQEFLGRRLL